MKITTETTLHLPEKIKLANTLADGNVDGKFGTMKSSYTVKPGEVDGKSEIHTTAGRYDKAAYNDFFDSRRTILSTCEPRLDIQGGQ